MLEGERFVRSTGDGSGWSVRGGGTLPSVFCCRAGGGTGGLVEQRKIRDLKGTYRYGL